MSRNLWLHIGAEKTGTTTIQACLSENRTLLRQNGILYPSSLGTSNHVALTAYGLAAPSLTDPLRIESGAKRFGSLEAFRQDVEHRLFAEVEQANCSTLVFSNEHCSSRLRTRNEVEQLRRLCHKVADQIRVVYYVRNPVDLLASWYSTSVKAGSTKTFPRPLTPALRAMIDFQAVINLWCAVFGEDNFVLRRFERARFVEGDLLRDFQTAIEIPHLHLPDTSPRNPSLSLPAIHFLREFNKSVPRIENGKINPLRGLVIEALQDFPSEARFTLSQQDANQILSLFEDDYRRIGKKYFGETDDLFEPAVNVSANGTPDAELGFEDCVKISALLWRFLQDKNIRLRDRLTRLSAPNLQPASRARS